MRIDHRSVLTDEVLSYLPVPEGGCLLDCTLGEGGHSLLFLEKYPKIRVIGLDRDSGIIERAIERLDSYSSRFTAVKTEFSEYLEGAPDESFDCILFDLGISMYHYKTSGRGFSFSNDEELDMRMDAESGITAYDVVNTYGEEELADVIYRYGEERYSRRIAKRIAEKRAAGPIRTASELSSLIYYAVPPAYRHGRINPSTRTFQAIRIEVNGELENLERALLMAKRVVKKGGRIAVITFHSLEDRIVKCFFRDSDGLSVLTKKPVVPSDEEKNNNKASRSAKLRVAERCL